MVCQKPCKREHVGVCVLCRALKFMPEPSNLRHEGSYLCFINWEGSPSPNNNNLKERDSVTGIFLKHHPLLHHLKPQVFWTEVRALTQEIVQQDTCLFLILSEVLNVSRLDTRPFRLTFGLSDLKTFFTTKFSAVGQSVGSKVGLSGGHSVNGRGGFSGFPLISYGGHPWPGTPHM